MVAQSLLVGNAAVLSQFHPLQLEMPVLGIFYIFVLPGSRSRARVCACAHVYMCVCICARVHFCLASLSPVCVCVCVCARARTRARVCAHVCMCFLARVFVYKIWGRKHRGVLVGYAMYSFRFICTIALLFVENFIPER